MAYRARACQHLMPSVSVPDMPVPAKLAALLPHMNTLMNAAAAFDACDEGGTWTAAEYITWLDADVRKSAWAVAHPGGRPK